MVFELLKAALFGVVEGTTEWLPVSSTSHMQLLGVFIRMRQSESFMSLFEVVIQLGAILAVLLLYWDRLWPFAAPGRGAGPGGLLKPDRWRLIGLVLLAILPSAAVGIPLDDWIDAHLSRMPVIAAMLILYGVLFIALERRPRRVRVRRAEDIDVRCALVIGAAQILALVPGTSRSGVTILTALMLGCARPAAAEFSFFMAIPTMAGASLLRLLKFRGPMSGAEALVLLTASGTAFIVSMLVIRRFIGYIRRHSFEPFGWYRVILGLLVAIVWAAQGVLF